MMDFFFNLIVRPLYFIFEFLFNQIYKISDDIFITIALISFFVSIMCLPLYLRADFLQDEEKKMQEKMAKKIKSIKKNFKGDERLLLLQTYYKQNNYHPIMGLRLALSLLLQIPIFLAAYTFFNDLTILNGLQYKLIEDLSKPDKLLFIGDFRINILPILMTLVNLLAGFVYTKTISFKENKILITVSLVFLALLYNAPSALVFYWLFNNIFSLIKNICLLFLSRENLVKSAILLVIIGYFIFSGAYENINEVVIALGIFVGLIVLKKTNFYNKEFEYNKLFFLVLFTYWFLIAIYIPSNVISISPTEFIFKDVIPYDILFYSGTVLTGLLLFWGFWIYYFSNKDIRKILSIIICIALFSALINIFMLKMPEGILTNLFSFEPTLVDFNYFKVPYKMLYLYLSLVIAYFIIRLAITNKTQFLRKIISCILISGIALSIYNYISIIQKTSTYLKKYKVENTEIKKYINLSKTKKNVLVIFLDRAINSYLPIIFEEHPQLNKQFKGFTYYPYTLSYSGYTLFGYLPIFGGYEYTPFRMDDRDELFEKKLYEATTVTPAIFSKNNWKVDIVNTVEKGLEDGKIDNNSFYKKYNINCTNIPISIIDRIEEKLKINSGDLSKRNLIYYSMLMVSSPETRNFIYNDGQYHNFLNNTDYEYKYNEKFLKSYAELISIDELTDFSSEENTFIVFNNYLPHSPMILRYPNYDLSIYNQKDYKPPFTIDDCNWSMKHYHVNVATLKFIGKYLDYLRKNNVYDNTRIIIVADHGFGYNLQNPYMGQFEADHYLPYNPLLLVKDFNSNDELKTSNEIMTNGDVPFIATKDIFNKLINPHTNKLMTDEDKKNGILIKTDVKWRTNYYVGKNKSLVKSDKFNYVKGNPLNHYNWKTNLTYQEALEIHNKQIKRGK